MKEYLLAIFGVCIIGTAVKSLAPDGAIKKYIEMLCTLCAVAVIIAPASSIISASYGLDGLIDKMKTENEDYNVIYKEYLEEKEIDRAEKLLCAELAEYLELSTEAIAVKIEVSDSDEDTVNIESVNVYLGAQAISASPEIIREYIYNRTEAECQIIYGLIDEK